MNLETISIKVDADAARLFTDASTQEKRQLELLLNLRLRELTAPSARPLREIMDEIGDNATARGLTPELLESFLNDQ